MRARGRPARLVTRRRLVIAASIGAAAGAGAVAVAVVLAAPVATIGTHPVSAEEYRAYAGIVQADQNPGSTASRADVLTAIARDQALLNLARQAGLGNVPATPGDLLATRDAANAQSEHRLESGQVVYGVGTYTVDQFHSRAVAQLGSATLNALVQRSDSRVEVTSQQVAAAYAADPGAWSAAATTYHFTTYTVPTVVDAQSTSALIDAVAAQQKPLSDLSPITSVEGSADIVGATSSVELSPDATAALPELRVGSFLPPQSGPGSWILYRLDAVSRDDAEALRTYTPQIRQSLVQHRFEALVEAQATRLRSD